MYVGVDTPISVALREAVTPGVGKYKPAFEGHRPLGQGDLG